MTVLRSLLFVPGNQPRMLERASGLKPDAFIPDMEDSVPLDEKANAREVTASYLAKLGAGGTPVIPRVNSLDTGLLDDDLAAVVGENILGVSVGKIETPEDIAAISAKLETLERKAGIEVGSVSLVPWIETAMAIVHLYEICTASPRIVGVAFGAEDFTNDMGIERTESESETYFARNSIAVAARAADVLALDTPYFSFRDPDGLRENASVARQYGFKGKFAIHPAQLEAIRTVFGPQPEEVEHARRVIQAWERAAAAGRGTLDLDGEMVDAPVVERARNLLAQAAETGAD